MVKEMRKKSKQSTKNVCLTQNQEVMEEFVEIKDVSHIENIANWQKSFLISNFIICKQIKLSNAKVEIADGLKKMDPTIC